MADLLPESECCFRERHRFRPAAERIEYRALRRVGLALVTKVVFALLGLFLAWLGIAVKLP